MLAADAKDKANQRPAYVHIKRDVDNNNTDVNVTRPTGNSRAKALRRLRDPNKGRPDIHARRGCFPQGKRPSCGYWPVSPERANRQLHVVLIGRSLVLKPKISGQT